MSSDPLARLRNEYQQSGEEDYYAGIEKGRLWAMEQATVKTLLRMSHWKRTVGGPFVLAQFVSKQLENEGIRIPYMEVFRGYVDITKYQTASFMTGFKDGCLQVLREIQNEKRQGQPGLVTQPKQEANGREAAAQACDDQSTWQGWYRGRPNQPWLVVVEGASEMEVLQKIINAPAGDKMVLPKGVHPDQQQTKGVGE